MKVHVIDGTYELFRAHYGAPPARGPDGRAVGATRGLVRSLSALMRDPDVSHVACAFDHVIESFRNELFAGYKTGEGIDPDLYAQFQLAEDAVRALGIVTWAMVEFEADDAMATAAERYGETAGVEQVVLCTVDKDLAQCVRGARVVCFDRMRRRWLDEPGVVEKFGVPPGAIADYLALVGDSADGIPGVPRWGGKSAAMLLSRFGSIEAIPDDPGNWPREVRGARALAESLAARRSDALLYKQLATLRTDVPLTESLEELRWGGARRTDVDALGAALGAPDLPSWVPRFQD